MNPVTGEKLKATQLVPVKLTTAESETQSTVGKCAPAGRVQVADVASRTVLP